jgi:hypothetical protein
MGLGRFLIFKRPAGGTLEQPRSNRSLPSSTASFTATQVPWVVNGTAFALVTLPSCGRVVALGGPGEAGVAMAAAPDFPARLSRSDSIHPPIHIYAVRLTATLTDNPRRRPRPPAHNGVAPTRKVIAPLRPEATFGSRRKAGQSRYVSNKT